MKKLLLIAGMFAFANMVSADEAAVEENAVVEDVADVDNEDGLTSIYASLGLGWEWLENKGNLSVSSLNLSRDINKQKMNRFRGMIGLGYQHLFAQHFLAGLEFDCEFAKKKDEIIKDSSGDRPYKIQNKGVTPAIYAKLGYAWCNKHVVYAKLGGQWKRARVIDTTNNDKLYDIDKFVFAGALGYQCKFTKKFSAFGEVTYSARQKKDNTINGIKFSTKTGESWGFNLGVTYHILTK